MRRPVVFLRDMNRQIRAEKERRAALARSAALPDYLGPRLDPTAAALLLAQALVPAREFDTHVMTEEELLRQGEEIMAELSRRKR